MSVRAARVVVLGLLAVAGDDRDHLAGRRAEGRTALGRVERGEPAGRAGADVHEPPATVASRPAIASIAAASSSPASATAPATVASSSLSSDTSSRVERARDRRSDGRASVGDCGRPVSAALTASQTSGESGVARRVMCPQAS